LVEQHYRNKTEDYCFASSAIASVQIQETNFFHLMAGFGQMLILEAIGV
jgi:hypothetical protein